MSFSFSFTQIRRMQNEKLIWPNEDLRLIFRRSLLLNILNTKYHTNNNWVTFLSKNNNNNKLTYAPGLNDQIYECGNDVFEWAISVRFKF